MKKTRSSSFSEYANKFTLNITRRLKIEKGLSTSRKPDPDPQTAWKYTGSIVTNPARGVLVVLLTRIAI